MPKSHNFFQFFLKKRASQGLTVPKRLFHQYLYVHISFLNFPNKIKIYINQRFEKTTKLQTLCQSNLIKPLIPFYRQHRSRARAQEKARFTPKWQIIRRSSLP